jgi:hypothetical protein
LAETDAMSFSGWLEYSRNVAALRRSMRNALLNCALHQAVLPVPRGPSKKKWLLGIARSLGVKGMLIAKWHLRFHYAMHNGNADSIMQWTVADSPSTRVDQMEGSNSSRNL